MAQMLHYNYSQPDYFLLGPPQTIALDEKWATRLNASLMLYRSSREVKHHPHQFRPGQMAVVQKVRPAPVPSFLCGVTKGKEQYFWDHLDQELLIHVTDFQAFEQAVLGQIEDLLIFLRGHPQFHCLLRDFQVLIDAQGQLHHLDLHRCINYEDGSINILELKSIQNSFRGIERFRRRMVQS
jgi:hypothetical protein